MTLTSINFTWPNGYSGALTTSWDDGTIYDRELVEILNRFGLKGTFNLNSGLLDLGVPQRGWKEYIRDDEVSTLYAAHEVAVHTVTHPHLERIPEMAVRAELLEDRRALESLVHYPVRGMAFPFGTYDQRVLWILQETGFVYARLVESREDFSLPGDFFKWQPTCHHRFDLNAMWARFKNDEQSDKLFYLWGHSYEFAEEDNWSVIKDFAQMAGNTSGIWYATNREIYDYVQAWRGLELSLDLRTACNLSAVTLWVRCGKRLIELPAGVLVQLDA